MRKINYYLSRDDKYAREIHDLSPEYTNLSLTEEFRQLNRIRYLFWGLILFTAILFFRISVFQLSQEGIFLKKSEGNRLLQRKVASLRGKILDAKGRPIALNSQGYSLYYFGNDSNELEEIVRYLKLDSEVGQDIPLQAFVSGRRILSRVSPSEARALAVKIEKYSSVLTIVPEPKRKYAHPLIGLGGVAGYIGKPAKDEWLSLNHSIYDFDDEIGKSGLEKYYESYLKGANGRLEIEVDSLGRQREEKRYVEPGSGDSIVLAIDLDMQTFLNKFLSEEVKLSGKRGGAAIVQDPNSGAILAIASYPDFDGNVFLDKGSAQTVKDLLNDSDHPLFFRPVQGLYPAGSTIKPIVASAALEEGLIDEKFNVLSRGGIKIGRSFFPDWKASGHGKTNLAKALSESVNTFFYIIGGGDDNFSGLGPGRINEYARRFGWGQKLGIDMYGEEDGFLPTPQWKEEYKHEKWYLGDTYHMAIGQGDVLVTPLQVSAMMSVIANGGTLFRPHLLKYVISQSGEIKNLIEPEIIYKDIISSSTLSLIRHGLRQAVQTGSARRLSSLPVEAAGKTGTAQTVSGSPHAWFTGFAPYGNPSVVITVLIENGEEGSRTAVPVAYRFLDWYFAHTVLTRQSMPW